MAHRIIQLFVTPLPGFRSRAQAGALSRALSANGAEVILTESGFNA
jgi:hypothetical protein